MKYIFSQVILKYKKEENLYDKLILLIPFDWLKENYEYFKTRIIGLKIKKNILISLDLTLVNFAIENNYAFLEELNYEYDLSIKNFNVSMIEMIIDLNPAFFSFKAFVKIKHESTLNNPLLNQQLQEILKKQNYFK